MRNLFRKKALIKLVTKGNFYYHIFHAKDHQYEKVRLSRKHDVLKISTFFVILKAVLKVTSPVEKVQFGKKHFHTIRRLVQQTRQNAIQQRLIIHSKLAVTKSI